MMRMVISQKIELTASHAAPTESMDYRVSSFSGTEVQTLLEALRKEVTIMLNRGCTLVGGINICYVPGSVPYIIVSQALLHHD
jgi:hypothetical protein